MERFEIYYMEKSGGTLRSVTKRSEEDFLDWVRTTGTKIWYFDVFHYGEEKPE